MPDYEEMFRRAEEERRIAERREEERKLAKRAEEQEKQRQAEEQRRIQNDRRLAGLNAARTRFDADIRQVLRAYGNVHFRGFFGTDYRIESDISNYGLDVTWTLLSKGYEGVRVTLRLDPEFRPTSFYVSGVEGAGGEIQPTVESVAIALAARRPLRYIPHDYSSGSSSRTCDMGVS